MPLLAEMEIAQEARYVSSPCQFSISPQNLLTPPSPPPPPPPQTTPGWLWGRGASLTPPSLRLGREVSQLGPVNGFDSQVTFELGIGLARQLLGAHHRATREYLASCFSLLRPAPVNINFLCASTQFCSNFQSIVRCLWGEEMVKHHRALDEDVGLWSRKKIKNYL